MENIQVSLDFHEVQVKGTADVVHLMDVVSKQGGAFRPAYEEHVIGAQEWPNAVRVQMQRKSGILKWSIWFEVRLAQFPDLKPSFAVDQFDDVSNDLYIGGVLDFELKDQRHLVEPFMQLLVNLGCGVYSQAQPMLGYVDETWSAALDLHDVLKLRLKHISWANWFGPAYVEKYGRDFLLGLPGHKTKLLPDGGVFHQLCPSFVATSQKQARELRQRVVSYCAQRGLRVTCTAPYYIPGLSPEPPRRVKAASDAVVRAFLKDALATTLVLTDGTRVKPIHIPWDTMTPRQMAMAIEAIKQAAIAEIKRPERARIRLELNQIPDDLDRTLAELAGRDNPDFEWVQVDMGPGSGEQT